MPSGFPWQRLCECLGLSEYEAKVYVSVVEAGSTQARVLSVRSGVPRTKVYGVLKKLIDMGLVLEIPGEPRKFAPTPPKTAFKSYLDLHQNMVENLISVVSSLEETLGKVKNEGGPQRGTIWIVSGRQEVLAKIREMLFKAKRSAYIATNGNGMVLLYKSFNRLFDELAERSVKVRIATSNRSDNQHLLSELKYTCEIEEAHFKLPLIFLCADGKQMFLANLRPDSFSLDSDRDRGIFFDDPVLCELIRLLVTRKADASALQSDTSEPEETRAKVSRPPSAVRLQ